MTVERLSEKLVGLVRVANFTCKADKDSEAVKLSREVSFDECTLNMLIEIAMDALVVKLQANLRTRPVSEWKAICATKYLVGTKAAREEMSPEVAASRAIAKMNPDQLKALADELAKMMKK